MPLLPKPDKAAPSRPQQTLRLPFPAPFDAFRSYRRVPADDLTVIKACRAAAIWSARRGFSGWAEASRLTGWLFRFPFQAVREIGRHGSAARDTFGRSLVAQIADLATVAVRNGLSPRDYYEGGLARCAGDDRLLRTIPYAVYETAVDAVLTATDRGGRAALEDKLAFEERCRAAGLPAVRTERILRDGWAESQEELSAIPPGAYLLKPRIGGQGRGIVGLSFDDRAASSERADFLRRATEHAKTVGGDVLLQHRAANHRDLAGLSSAALATTRIVTIWNERDEPEVVEAFYRTSTSPSAPVDNFHAGGTFYPLDIASGTLREGFGPRFAERPVPLETHPLSGQRMAGRPLPGWSGMSDLALALARVFPDVPIVGWDVGYTPTGPLAVEGNAPPGITPTRQFSTGGLVGTRFLTLVAHHAARWLVAHEPAGSRWRPNALAIPRHQPSGGAPAR